MLTVEDEAREYLYVLLDHLREHVPRDACFRLSCDRAGHPILALSRETGDDELSEHQGRTVLVWDPQEFPPSRERVLELDQDDLEGEFFVLADSEREGTRFESVVELDKQVQDILARAS